MTTRTREKRRRRKALARWRRRDTQRRFNEIMGPALDTLRALTSDALAFGRSVVSRRHGFLPRRLPPSEWFRAMERADREDAPDAVGFFLGVLDEMDARRAAAFRTTVTKIEEL